MVIPWRLVLTAAVGILVASAWASRRARARRVPEQAPVDAGIVLAIAGVVSGRLVVLLVDATHAGLGALDPRAALTLGAGVATPGALLGVLAAGAWLHTHGKVPAGAWRAGIPPVALGLAAWSLLALARGAAGGIAAPFPLGWRLPGYATTRVPVAVLEALAFAGFALAVSRAERRGPTSALTRMPGPRLAALLLALAAGVHLAGGMLRPSVATVDADLDVLLGLLALGAGLGVALSLDQRLLRRSIAGATVGVLLIGGFALIRVPRFPGPLQIVVPDELQLADDQEAEPIPRHGAGERLVPVERWAEADLAAFVAEADTPVVVNVWASWCPPCRAEAPVLARSAEAYAGQVRFLGLNVDRDADAAWTFARRYGLPFPSVGDGGLRGALGVPGLPTTVVVRPDGSIAARLVGGLDARSLAAAIDRAR
jgi:thiol-disulfide isomerase/thioredoxin